MRGRPCLLTNGDAARRRRAGESSTTPERWTGKTPGEARGVNAGA